MIGTEYFCGSVKTEKLATGEIGFLIPKGRQYWHKEEFVGFTYTRWLQERRLKRRNTLGGLEISIRRK